MSRAVTIFLVITALYGCADRAKEAEEQYRIVERTGGTTQERCDAAGKVADAYLEQKNEKDYQFWRLIRDTACLSAKLGVMN